MSRKSSRRNPPDPFPDPPVYEQLYDERLTVHRLTGDLEETLDTLVSGCAFLARLETLDDDRDDAAEPAEPAEDGETDYDDAPDGPRGLYGGITLTTRILARALLGRALDRQPASAADDDGADAAVPEDILDDLTQALLPPDIAPSLKTSRLERKAAFDDAALLIREMGLEEFGVSCALETADDGVHELVAFAVSTETAHVELLEFLINRAETVALETDPLLATERDASAWEFSRWSVSPPPGRHSADADFARHVREQEYSLVDRSTMALGTSVIGGFADNDLFGGLYPGQRRLVEGLAASFVDIFECVAVTGNRTTLRSVRSDQTYVVHEHLEPVEYAVGWVAAGRLIPFDSELYLRSPGMVFARADAVDDARSAAAFVDTLEDALPPALALEAFISSVMMGVDVPRVMKPMRSRADAREQLDSLRFLLLDAQLEPDATLGAFASALAEQGGHGLTAQGPPPGAGRRATRPANRRRR